MGEHAPVGGRGWLLRGPSRARISMHVVETERGGLRPCWARLKRRRRPAADRTRKVVCLLGKRGELARWKEKRGL